MNLFRVGLERFSLAAATRLFQTGSTGTLDQRSDSITSNADLQAARMWLNDQAARSNTNGDSLKPMVCQKSEVPLDRRIYALRMLARFNH